jgi:hypothetical protein
VGSLARMTAGYIHERTSDSDTLLLPARELTGKMVLTSGAAYWELKSAKRSLIGPET